MSVNGTSHASGPNMIRRASGVLVEVALEKLPEVGRTDPPTAYDADGRRRVVLDKVVQKRIDWLVTTMRARGLAALVFCWQRDDDVEPCGGPLVNEGNGETSGYGCKCTRIYFL